MTFFAVVESVISSVTGAWSSKSTPTSVTTTRRGSSVLAPPEAAALRCTGIDRVAAGDMTAARFHREYRGARPVILTGATEGWAATERWRKAALLRDHGDARVEVGDPAEIVAFGGTGSAFTTLARFVGGFGRNGASTDRFVFDSSELLQQRPALRSDFATPAPFEQMMAEEDGGASWQMLSIGDEGGGLSFHSHGESWLGLVHGAKRWLIYPPGGAPRELFESLGPIAPRMRDWARESLPQLQRHAPPAADCLQTAGEAVYVPAGWLHATLNVGETIGAGGQAHWSASARRDLALSAPHDMEALRNLGLASGHLGEKELAVQHLTQALELGGGEDVSLLIKLVEASGRLGRQAEAAAHAQKALGLLGGLADATARGDGNVASTGLAAYYYALASLMGSLGAPLETVQTTFEHALALAEHGPTFSSAHAEATGEMSEEEEEEEEDSAMACRIAFQLAMSAGKRGLWGEAVDWLERALLVPRALSAQHTTRATTMLAEAAQAHARSRSVGTSGGGGDGEATAGAGGAAAAAHSPRGSKRTRRKKKKKQGK